MTGDSWRPSQANAAKRGRDGGGDSYRPQVPRGEFTFTAGDRAPQFSSFPADRNLNSGPSGRRGGRGNNNGARARPYSNQRAPPAEANDGRPRRNFEPRGGRRGNFFQHPTERPLLQLRGDGSSPEHTMGVADGSSKFRDPDELSEGEAPMDVEDDEEDGPQAKSIRTLSSTRPDGDSVPKWSNPDPYTSMPPAINSTPKDFIGLIRRAKKQEEDKQASGLNPVAANNDFISFDDDGDMDGNTEKGFVPPPPPGSPPPPSSGSPPPPPPGPLPARPASFAGTLNDYGFLPRRTLPDDRLPAKFQFDAHSRGSQMSSNHVQPQLPARPGHKRKRGDTYGMVQPEWDFNNKSNPTPWYHDGDAVTRDSRWKKQMTRWLHNEIMDFYDYVSPTDADRSVREQLQHDIISILRNNPPKAALFSREDELVCFGSFPVGLYLPTADLDLVVLTKRFMDSGLPVLSRGNAMPVLRAVGKTFVKKGITTTYEAIGKAKVPILKFVDRKCNIKVDISFDNTSGQTTQHIYKKWKADYSDMCYLVALVKQFLLMRGLNEVHTGGLGGYSVICLCVFFLKYQAQLNIEYHDFGAMFLDFLDFYGNKFDLRTTRIVIEPPALVYKAAIGIDGRPEKADGLSIQDPDNPRNNISGGSSRVQQIFREFSKARVSLQDRMDELAAGRIRPSSILGVILGGNYQSYVEHRHLIANFRK